MKKLLLIFAAFSLVFASCEKNEDDTTPIDASKQKLLMDGYWQLTNYMVVANVDDSLSFPEDQFTPIPGCTKDNLFKFLTSSTYVMYEGETKCTLGAPDSTMYSYQLLDNEKKIEFWSNPDDRENSIIYNAEITYPSLEQYILTYRVYDENEEITSEHVRTYSKMK